METVSTTYEERGITLKQHLLRKAEQTLEKDGVLPVDLITQLMQDGVDVNAFEKAWHKEQHTEALSGQGRLCFGCGDSAQECDCE